MCCIAQSLRTLSKVMRPSVLKPLDRSLHVYTAYSQLQSHSTALGNTKLELALYHLHPHMCVYTYSLPMELNNRLLTQAFLMLNRNNIRLFIDNWLDPDAQ